MFINLVDVYRLKLKFKMLPGFCSIITILATGNYIMLGSGSKENGRSYIVSVIASYWIVSISMVYLNKVNYTLSSNHCLLIILM